MRDSSWKDEIDNLRAEIGVTDRRDIQAALRRSGVEPAELHASLDEALGQKLAQSPNQPGIRDGRCGWLDRMRVGLLGMGWALAGLVILVQPFSPASRTSEGEQLSVEAGLKGEGTDMRQAGAASGGSARSADPRVEDTAGPLTNALIPSPCAVATWERGQRLLAPGMFGDGSALGHQAVASRPGGISFSDLARQRAERNKDLLYGPIEGAIASRELGYANLEAEYDGR